MNNLLDGLNPEQKRAVESTEGPLLIQAGAGSGKTKTLTHRIAYILSKRQAMPGQILAVTFTNKAAREMRDRLAKLVGHSPDDRSFVPFMGTFHSICVRILRRDGEHIKVPGNFVIFDEQDRLSAIKQVCKQLGVDEKTYPAKRLSYLISNAKNELMDPSEYAKLASSPLEDVIHSVHPAYEKTLREAGALDFDDLISKTVDLLNHHSEIRLRWQDRFKYILIDEYQDTNAAQYQLVKLLVNKDRNIAVVGDDWQSIYSWRGANYQNILNFERDFPNTTVIKLEQNYRSQQNILDAAHQIISKNASRSDKRLWTDIAGTQPVQVIPVNNEREEAATIVRRIQESQRPYSDSAILYRTNAQSRAIEEACLHFGLPYRIVGGVRFYDRAEIKDILAYLRLIFQPNDRVSFERIVNVPSRGIGATSLRKFFVWQTSRNLSLRQALTQIESCSELTDKAINNLADFSNILEDLRKLLPNSSPETIIDSLLKRTEYLSSLDDGTIQGESRRENVQELLTVAKQYNDIGLEGFLEEVALVSEHDQAKDGERNDAVVLMTLHSSKGLEFPVIYMPGMEESILPHSRALFDQSEMEEERRLCYVGMTRAKEELYMLHASSRALYGGVGHNPPSRFLIDISDDTPSHNHATIYNDF